MPEERYITIVSERKTIALRVSTILYVLMNGKYANIHVEYYGYFYTTCPD